VHRALVQCFKFCINLPYSSQWVSLLQFSGKRQNCILKIVQASFDVLHEILVYSDCLPSTGSGRGEAASIFSQVSRVWLQVRMIGNVISRLPDLS
jgi:hypothetical protein